MSTCRSAVADHHQPGRCRRPRDRSKPRIGGNSSNATAQHYANEPRQRVPGGVDELELEVRRAEVISVSLDLPAHQPIVSTRRTQFDGTSPHGDKVRWHEGHTSMAKDK